jgi:hypothetical protein
MWTSGILGGRFFVTEAPKARPLPVRPNIERLRNEAKQRLVFMKATSATARLSDAQLLVACSYGFSSWQSLKAEVDRRYRLIKNAEQTKQLPLTVVFRPKVISASSRWVTALSEPQQLEGFFFLIPILLMAFMQLGGVLTQLLLSKLA